ncbi:hypothetical protein U1Q18_050648, partial [Sarracenia purpurea var. burkii]
MITRLASLLYLEPIHRRDQIDLGGEAVTDFVDDTGRISVSGKVGSEQVVSVENRDEDDADVGHEDQASLSALAAESEVKSGEIHKPVIVNSVDFHEPPVTVDLKLEGEQVAGELHPNQ